MSFKVDYGDVESRGEPLRLAMIMLESDGKYEEIPIPRWLSERAKEPKPLGQMPRIMFDGRSLPQMSAIRAYLCAIDTKNKLFPKSAKACAIVEGICAMCDEFNTQYSRLIFEADDAWKKESWDRATKIYCPNIADVLETCVDSNGNIIGVDECSEPVTIAGLSISVIVRLMNGTNERMPEGVLTKAKYPNLFKMAENVAKIPAVKKARADTGKKELPEI